METLFADTAILYVDDEEKSLKYFREIFEDIATIYTAPDGASGLEVFREKGNEIGLILSDQRMPGISGIEFLKQAREINDKPLRVLVTAFADLQTAVSAMNEDLLYGYHTKPWDPEELEQKIKQALQHFVVARDRDRLLQEKAQAFQQLMVAEKAATLGTVSNGLNHHMRNSLTVIQGFFDMIPGQLSEELAGADPKDSFFWNDYYRNASNQLQRLVDILAKLTEGTVSQSAIQNATAVDIRELIEGAVADAKSQGDDVSYQILCSEELPSIEANASGVARMVQLILHEKTWNLTEGKNEIEIHLSRQLDENREEVGVTMSFVDNGDPLSEQDQKHLFDPFHVRDNRPAELGMDLMACYLTAFEHGGQIKAEAAPDGRNLIEVNLPAKPLPSPDRNAFEQFFA